MADTDAAPTGAFGEGAPERPRDEGPPAAGSRESAQDFSRQAEAQEATTEGTAEHVPVIDRSQRTER